MRLTPALTALTALVAISGCQLPDRRPSGAITLRACSDPLSEIGTVINHRECLILDGSASVVFAGGRPRYEWRAEIHSSPPVTVALSTGTASTISGAFFQDVVQDDTAVDIRLRVVDGSGHDREVAKRLVLENSLPVVRARPSVFVPRTALLDRFPYLVVHPDAIDADGDPLSSRVEIVSGTSLDGVRCNELPAPYPDPVPGQPAWCFALRGSEDLLADTETHSFRFRIRVWEAAGAEPPAPGPGECKIDGDPTLTCEDWEFGTTVWAMPLSFRAARLSPEWRRIESLTEKRSDADAAASRAWFVEQDTDCFFDCEPDALLTIDLSMNAARASRVGSLMEMEPGRSRIGASVVDGLWVYAFGSGTAGWPSAISASPNPNVQPGFPFMVFVPGALADADVDLGTVPHEDLRWVTFMTTSGGFSQVRSFDTTDDGSLWLAVSQVVGTSSVHNVVRIDSSAFSQPDPGISAATPIAPDGTFSFGNGFGGGGQILAGAGATDMWVSNNATGKPTLERWRSTGLVPPVINVPSSSPTGSTGDRRVFHLTWDSAAGTLYGVQEDAGERTVLKVTPPSGVQNLGRFDDLRDLATDATGGLWVDNMSFQIGVGFSRQIAYLPSDATPTAQGWPYEKTSDLSGGGGVAVLESNEGPTAVLADDRGIALVSLDSMREVHQLASFEGFARLAGIDPRDGSAFVAVSDFFGATKTGVSRVQPSGDPDPLPLFVYPGASLATAVLAPPHLRYDRDEMTTGTLWISTAIVSTAGLVSEAFRIDLPAVDAAVRAGGFFDLRDLRACDAVETYVTPCYATREPVSHTGVPWIGAWEASYSPADERIYVVGIYDEDFSGVPQTFLLSAAIDGNGLLEGGVTLTPESSMSGPAAGMISPFLHQPGGSGAWLGGAWVREEGAATRYSWNGTTHVADTVYRVTPASGLRITAIACDPIAGTFLVAYAQTVVTGPTEPDAGALGIYSTMPVVNGTGTGPKGASGIAPLPFRPDLVFLGGEAVRRVKVAPNGALTYEYVSGDDIQGIGAVWTGVPF